MPHKTTVKTKKVDILEPFNAKNKIVSVFYYYWINTSNPDNHYSFIDVIELVFDDNTTLFFKINDDDSGIITTTDFEFNEHKSSLIADHLQQILFKKIDVTQLKIWKPILIDTFEKITEINEDDYLYGSSFKINFKNESIELYFHPVNGLVVSECDE